MPDVILSVKYPCLPPPVEGPSEYLTVDQRLTLAFQAELVKRIIEAHQRIDGDIIKDAHVTVDVHATPYWAHNRCDYEVMLFASTGSKHDRREPGFRGLTPTEALERRHLFASVISDGLMKFMDGWYSSQHDRRTFAITIMLLDSSGVQVGEDGQATQVWGLPVDQASTAP